MNLEPPKAEIRSATRVTGGPVTPRKGPPKFKQRQTRQFKSKPPKKGVQGHHGHLPMGGLQPPGAARTGPVWHHLAPEPDPEPQGRTPCCPPRPLLRIPVRRPAPRVYPDFPVCVWSPLQGGILRPPDASYRKPTSSLQDTSGPVRPCLASRNTGPHTFA